MADLRISIAKRLKEILFLAKKYGLVESQKHFGELLGYTDKAYISSIFNGRVNANDFILSLGDKLPMFDTNWIRTGQGMPIKRAYLESNRQTLLDSYLGGDELFPEEQTPKKETPTPESLMPEVENMDTRELIKTINTQAETIKHLLEMLQKEIDKKQNAI